LTTIQKGQGKSRWNGLVERSIIQQDCGRLPAQFERYTLHRGGGIPHDGFTHGH
jgi:hypothetical protein